MFVASFVFSIVLSTSALASPSDAVQLCIREAYDALDGNDSIRMRSAGFVCQGVTSQADARAVVECLIGIEDQGYYTDSSGEARYFGPQDSKEAGSWAAAQACQNIKVSPSQSLPRASNRVPKILFGLWWEMTRGDIVSKLGEPWLVLEEDSEGNYRNDSDNGRRTPVYKGAKGSRFEVLYINDRIRHFQVWGNSTLSNQTVLRDPLFRGSMEVISRT